MSCDCVLQINVISHSVGYWKSNQVVALFEFDNADNATRWFHSDSDVKQPDFQDRVDAILLPAFRAIRKYTLRYNYLVMSVGHTAIYKVEILLTMSKI